jgi:hypothetical protein
MMRLPCRSSAAASLSTSIAMNGATRERREIGSFVESIVPL